MNSILDRLSKQYKAEMGLAPIPEGTMVQFCNVKAGVWTPAVERHVTPAGLHIPGRVKIRDPFGGKNGKTPTDKMIYFTPTQDSQFIDNKEVNRGIEEYVRFVDTGMCTCTDNDSEKMYFLMVHNKRRENPFRLKGPENAVRFYLVDEKRDAFKHVSTFTYEVMAGRYLEDADDATLLNVAARLNSRKVHFIDLNLANPDDGNLFIRQEMVKVIKAAPMDFLLATGDERFKFKMLLDHELGERNILWDESKRHFYWRAKSGKEAVICEVAVGNKPQPALLDYVLGEEGGKFKNELKIRDEKHNEILSR